MSAPNWGYRPDNGPSHWAKNYPSAAGKSQSPIDIKTGEAHYDSSLTKDPLKIQYSGGQDFNVSNSGHSLVVSRNKKEGWNLSGGPLEHKYRFEQFHFHWGDKSDHGSEHLLDGKAFPAELHLVHWNTDLFSSFGDAATKEKGLAVLGFFVDVHIGKDENDGLKTIEEFIPKVLNIGEKQEIKIPFNLTSMLSTNTKDYWTYSGSLTTPPCSESVSWFVFKKPIYASERQMKLFRKLHSHDGGCIVNNFRPVMDANGRKVRASFK